MKAMRSPRVLLAAYLIFLLAILIPWQTFQNHSHWFKVRWIPFAPPVRWSDVLLNVLAFVPFGWLVRRAFRTGRGPWAAVAAGCLLSATAELTQVYSHGRFPTMTDVASNTIGSAIGAWCAGAWGRK